MLLDGHIGEVDVHVVQFLYVCVVLHGAEATESQLEQVAFEGPERCHQYIQSQVKLLASNQQRVVNVSVSVQNPDIYCSHACFLDTRTAALIDRLLECMDSNSLQMSCRS